MPKAEEMDKITEALDDFISSVYADYVYYYSYEVTDITFARSYEGKYTIEYNVDVRIRETESDELSSHHPFHTLMLVYV